MDDQHTVVKGSGPRGGVRWYVHRPDGTRVHVNLGKATSGGGFRTKKYAEAYIRTLDRHPDRQEPPPRSADDQP